MNLRVLAADLEDRVDPPVDACRADEAAPVLWAVISSLTMSAPTSSPISSRPEPVVPTPSTPDAVAELGADLLAAPLSTTSTGRASVLT